MHIKSPITYIKIWAFPYGSGYTLQCQLALRDSVGISAAIPNAKAKSIAISEASAKLKCA
jgi:hypothetical protein